jgi:hypothetical protein
MLSHGNVHLWEGKNPHGGDRRWVTKDVYLSHNKRTTLALHLASSCPIRMTYLEKPPPPYIQLSYKNIYGRPSDDAATWNYMGFVKKLWTWVYKVNIVVPDTSC